MLPKRKLNEGTRIAELLLEFIIVFFISFLFSLPAMNNDSFGFFRITHEAYKLETLSDPLIYLSIFGFALLLCKDCINGQSPAKRIIKLQVVDNKTGEVATPIQCFVRNITLLILPIEIIVALVRPDRRIGDKIAGTKLVIYYPETNNQAKPPLKKYILPLVSSYAVFVILAFLLSKIIFNTPQTRFVANTYNESKSKALEKLLTGNFSKYYKVSVKYYDSIENKKIQYVSVICFFKEPIINNPLTNQIENETIDKLYSMFPKHMINGRIQTVYFSGNEMTTWENIIGIKIMEDD